MKRSVNKSKYKLLLTLSICIFLFGCKKKKDNDIIYQTYMVENPQGKTDSMSYDLNNDGEMDLIAIRNTESLSGGGLKSNGKIYGLKEKMLFTFLRTDPEYRMLDTTDLIRNSRNFEWTDTLIYFGDGWQGIFTPNFGYQYRKDGINFGWFRFSTGRLSESGFNRTTNKGIKIGQKE
jgi:hypothetical protein